MFALGTFLDGIPVLLAGTVETLKLFVLSLLCGGLVAWPVALARNSRTRVARWFALAFIFVFRGAPLLVLLYLIYYGLPQFAFLRRSFAWVLLREPYICAVLALSLNSAGYVAEILGGAMRATPRGEVEAAQAAGLNRVDVFRFVILPHTARIALRAYSNEVVFLIKGTSAASLVTIVELMGSANAIYFNTYDPFMPYLCAGFIYLSLVFCLTRLVARAERRLSPELRLAAEDRASAGTAVGFMGEADQEITHPFRPRAPQ
jgi:putative lysine/arginine/ornithine/histidine/octopine transport system permease protein